MSVTKLLMSAFGQGNFVRVHGRQGNLTSVQEIFIMVLANER
jgi:hypothetical protein